MKYIANSQQFIKEKKEFRDVDMDKQFANPWYKKFKKLLNKISSDQFNNHVYVLPHYPLGNFMGHPNARLVSLDYSENPIYNWENISFNIEFDTPKSDEYIQDFEYTWIYDYTDDQLQEIYDNISNPENIKKNKRRMELVDKKRKYFFESDREDKTYQEKLDYWNLLDEISDLEGNVPDEEELAKRKARNEKSEEQYNKESEYMRKLMDDILKDSDKR